MRASRASGPVGPLGAVILAILATVAGAPARAADTTTLRATYAISLAGVTVGKAEAEGRFSGKDYAAAIVGWTSGISRLVSDASARFTGNGRIAGGSVLPSAYDMASLENGLASHVTMAMRQGTVTSVVALPEPAEAADRIPVTAADKAHVVDPLAAFLVPVDGPGLSSGESACGRTVKVFDGWMRYDVQLSYKNTKAVDGGADTYSGRVIVCGARYIPVAGHRSMGKTVQEMANNKRLEVWLVPVAGTHVLVPFRLLIGTNAGDLVIYATRFATGAPERHAMSE